MGRRLERNDYRSVSFRRTEKAGDGMSAEQLGRDEDGMVDWRYRISTLSFRFRPCEQDVSDLTDMSTITAKTLLTSLTTPGWATRIDHCSTDQG